MRVWLTDRLGGITMRESERLPGALAMAGVPMSTEGVTVRGMSMSSRTPSSGRAVTAIGEPPVLP
jgi:hypothetical protein